MVEEISYISVLSRFLTFQLKQDKICDLSHGKVRYFLIKRFKTDCFKFRMFKTKLCFKNVFGKK